MNYLVGLFCFLFVAAFSSQTLVDICDTLIVTSAVYLIYKNKDYPYLKTIFKYWYFWTGWLIVIFLGLFLNCEIFPWIYFFEFRWFISLAGMLYLLIQIKKFDLLVTHLGLTMLILNIISIVLYFVRGDLRAGGIYNGVMAYSQNMGVITCFFVTYLSCVNKFNLSLKNKKILYGLVLSSVVLTILTLTRGVWISSALGISVCAFFIPKKVFAYTVATIILIFSSLTFLSESFKNRIVSTDASTQTSNNQRKNIWTANLEIFKDYPILGVGYTQNNIRLTDYYEKLNIPQSELKSHAHNQYLHFAAGTGLLGLVFYSIFLLTVFKNAVTGYFKSTNTKTKSLYLSLLSAFISFVVAGFAESNFSISKNRLLFIFFCAFIFALVQIDSMLTKPS